MGQKVAKPHHDTGAYDKDCEQKSKEVDRAIKRAEQEEQEVSKLLLLGAGDSGKSTLFKQMRLLYGKGFPEADRKQYIASIDMNLWQGSRVLITQAEKYGGISAANAASKAFVLEAKDERLDTAGATHIKAIWRDPGAKKAYEHREEYYWSESTPYFFDRLDEIASTRYVPTQEDILRCRVPTTGIVETSFSIDGNLYRMLDVGGQRSERKKWIHCFEDVTAVLFVANIAAFDQKLYEDELQPALDEAVSLFDFAANHKAFVKTSIVLFLNKRDLLASKLETSSLAKYYPAYKGNSYDDAVEFITGLFLAKAPMDKKIYSHVTCATDTTNVGVVFLAVKDIIITQMLKALELA
jgi:guanine nucleotide-binding protein subunit alpha